MELSKPVIELIKRTLRVSKLLKLDSVAIETEQIRAMNASRTVAIIEKDVPELPFEGLGISTVGVLQSRLNIMDGREYNIDCTLLPNGLVRQLDIVSDSTQFEYRCCNTAAVKAVRNLKDVPGWEFTINEKNIQTLAKAFASMSNEFVNVKCNSKRQVSLVMEDPATSDKFTERFFADTNNLIEEDGSTEFDFHYNVEVFLLALKNTKPDKNGNVSMVVNSKGSISTILDNITVYIIPSDPHENY